MGVSVDSGPNVVVGSQNPQQNDNPEAGPSLFYASAGLTDPRQALSLGQAPNYGKVYGLYSVPQLVLIDGFPQAPATNSIATNASGIVIPSSGSINFPLVTTNSLSANVGVPVVPWTTTRNASGFGLSSIPGAFAAGNAVNCIALDFGAAYFTLPAAATVTATPLTSNVTSPGAVVPGTQSLQSFPANVILTALAASTTNWKNPLKFYQPGNWIIVPGAGNAGGTAALMAQIVALDYVQGFIVLDRPCLNTSANATGVGVGTADPNGIGAWPYTRIGATALFDPAQVISRTLSVLSSNAGDTAIVVQVVGFDCWGQPMTENITSNGTTPVLGKKAFKYISSANLSKGGGATTAGTITIGTGAAATGAFGFPMYVDQFEYLEIFANAAAVTANTGFTAGLAFTTNPATFTTADNRGTYVMQTAPSGAVHLTVFNNVPQYQVTANLLNYAQLFGLTQT